MANLKPTAQMGALTLVFLVKEYRSQMIALLVKNGIVVNNNTSDEEVAKLMANLLKVSTSYVRDLQNFITNPNVAKVIGSKITQTAQYFQMSGNGYMNSTGGEDGYTDTGEPAPVVDPVTGGIVTTPVKSESFWDNLNLSDLLGKGVDLFKTYTKGQSDAEIAKQHALVEQAKADAIKAGNETYIDPTTGQKINVKTDTGMSTSTIVIISVVGVALLGTIIYFVARPKK
jgi:hypothetical protein